jgi:catechol 2,3-dioxygenase-like lactoylglutathione lyase family enzyme
MATSRETAQVVVGDVGEDGVPSPVLHHVNLKTTRLAEMIEWYGVVCGMRANFRSEMVAFLSNDAANHRIALAGVDGLSDDPEMLSHNGMHHSAFEFKTLEHMMTRYATLKAKGILPHSCLDHGLTLSFYYMDPDGNSVELQVDNYGDWEKSTEWISTAPEFVADPIGAPVDPEQILVAMRDGADADEVHRRAYAREFPPATPPDLRLPPSVTLP